MMGNVAYGWERLKDIVGKDARQKVKETKEQEKKQTETDVDLTTTENERALRGAYKNFVIPGLPKADIDDYIDHIKIYIKLLIADQLKKRSLQFKVIWKKPIK